MPVARQTFVRSSRFLRLLFPALSGTPLWMLCCAFLLVGCAAGAVRQTPDIQPPPAPSPSVSAVYPLDTLADTLEPQAGAEINESEELPEPDTLPGESTQTPASQQSIFDACAVPTEHVDYYFTLFTDTHRKTFQAWLDRSRPYFGFVLRELETRNMPPELALLPFAESGYNVMAYSRAGAGGMWQFMPATGRKFNLRVDWWMDERRDPYSATRAALDYLQELHARFNDWYLALAAYNAGEGRIERGLKNAGCESFSELAETEQIRSETKRYVPKFLAIVKIFSDLENLGFTSPLDADASAPERLSIPPGTDLLALSKAVGIPWQEFRQLNPSFLRMVSPPDATFTISLPNGHLAQAKDYLENGDGTRYAGLHRHQVRSGDSFWTLSRRYGVPTSVLMAVNERQSSRLRTGEFLLVPLSEKTADEQIARQSTRGPAETGTKHSATPVKNGVESSRYAVRGGDSLWSIARRHKTTVNALCRLNNLPPSATLRVGMELRVPVSEKARAASRTAKTKARTVSYTVRSGDTLWDIARGHGVSYQDLTRWNSLENRYIRPGERLTIYLP